MKFSLLSQWSLTALAWIVLGVVVSAIDVGSDTGRPFLEVALFALWVLPGALILTAIAIRNSWMRLTDPARFKRDRARGKLA